MTILRRVSDRVRGLCINRFPTHPAVRDFLSYDPLTGLFRWKVSTARTKKGAVAGYQTPQGYVKVQVGGRSYPAHRLAWFFLHGSDPEGQIDHVNRIRDDNRATNLRQVTASQNALNRGTSARPWYDASRRRWVVTLYQNRRVLFKKRFLTLGEAEAAIAEQRGHPSGPA